MYRGPNPGTKDAPLWFAVVCNELAANYSPAETAALFDSVLDRSGRTLREVLLSIAKHYSTATPNGIRMDTGSALVWSPSHFTWMDTNYPAGTPREGYPIEIQALWIRLLRLAANLCPASEKTKWETLAQTALGSLEKFFWLEHQGFYADVLLSPSGQPASKAVCDDALRSNCLIPISFGLLAGARAQRCVQNAARYLVIPGGLRSLAPLPVSVPLPIRSPSGGLLNNPKEPYWGRYEGDEDTRRKPAYHNGTGWTWTFPIFCEALARCWDYQPSAVAAAKAYLGSMAPLLQQGCLGQLPENLDGDAPHLQRGCDAQAWAASEALRVWRLLNHQPQPS